MESGQRTILAPICVPASELCEDCGSIGPEWPPTCLVWGPLAVIDPERPFDGLKKLAECLAAGERL